jgi:hypothetical protein
MLRPDKNQTDAKNPARWSARRANTQTQLTQINAIQDAAAFGTRFRELR